MVDRAASFMSRAVVVDFHPVTRSESGAKVGASSRHEILTLADLVVASACSIKSTLDGVPGLALDHIDGTGWIWVSVEYAVLNLYLLSEHAHQVLEEQEAFSAIGEIVDRVGQGLSRRLAATRDDRRTVVVFFGETLKKRFAAYQRQPMVVDPESGDMVEIESFDRLHGTVFGSFVEALAPLLCTSPAVELPPAARLDLWLDTLKRSEAFGRVYTPVIDLLAVR